MEQGKVLGVPVHVAYEDVEERVIEEGQSLCSWLHRAVKNFAYPLDAVTVLVAIRTLVFLTSVQTDGLAEILLVKADYSASLNAPVETGYEKRGNSIDCLKLRSGRIEAEL